MMFSPLLGTRGKAAPPESPIHPDLQSRYGRGCFLETKEERLEVTQLVVNEALSGFSDLLFHSSMNRVSGGSCHDL